MSSNIFLYNGGKLEKFGAETLPKTKEINNVDWVIFGTDEDWNNQQPQYYDYLSKCSPKNGSILRAKDRYVYGKGFEIDESKPVHLDLEDKVKLEGFIRKTASIAKRIVSDRNKYNGFAVEVIFEGNKQKIIPYYVPFKNVRVSKDEYDDNGDLKPTKFYYTKDWSKPKNKILNSPDFVEFDEWDWDAESYSQEKRYLIYYKGEEYLDDYYPLPDYVGGVPYISADCDVANFVKNNTANGFTAGALVNFYDGEPTPDAKRLISNMLDEAFTGTDNAGKVIKSFNEGEKGVEITPINANGQDDRFINLNNQIREEVFTAHTTSPLVVGMRGENGFNNNSDEKRVAVEDFTESFVLPTQEPINDLFNNILDFNDVKGEIKLERLDPIKPSLPVDKLFEVASAEELRELYKGAGYELKDEAPGVEQTSQQLKEINLVFSKEDDKEDSKAFEAFGTDDLDYEFIDSRPLIAKDVFDAQKQGEVFKHEFATRLETSILSLIATNNAITAAELSDLLNVDTGTVNDALNSLESQGLLSDGNITPDGQKEIEQNEVFVVYKYELREDAAPLKGGRSREFCSNLMRLSASRSWTIQDIQAISAQRGYDVFTRRGGWYTLPNTNIHRPFCRHQWSQRLVRKK